MKMLSAVSLFSLSFIFSACATSVPKPAVIVSWTSPYHGDQMQSRAIWRTPSGSCYDEVWYQPGLFGMLLESGPVPCPTTRQMVQP